VMNKAISDHAGCHRIGKDLGPICKS